MRIVHLTDLHYSSIDCEYDFKTLFSALLDSLKLEQKDKKIDLVLITGDLIDKGGKNVKKTKPGKHYDIVLKEVIEPLAAELKLQRKQIVILPGNHDVCENADNYFVSFLRNEMNLSKINNLIKEYKTEWPKDNSKIDISGLKAFKDFEKKFYKGTRKKPDFEVSHTNFETGFIYKFGEARVGVAAFNSAWTCATALDKTGKLKLAFGAEQIRRMNEFFKDKTDFNIALLHHPVNMKIYSPEEEREIKFYLSQGNFHVLFCGHTHEVEDYYIKEKDASYYLIVTKASLNNPRILEEKYKSGFSLIDFTYSADEALTVTRHFRKYFHPGRFDFDTDVAARAQNSLQIEPGKVGKKFINYLKSQSGTFDPERKALLDTLSSFSQNYIKSPFPDLISVAIKSSFDNFFKSNFNYIRKNVRINWEIKPYGDNQHLWFNESQNFIIESTRDPILYQHAIFVDTILDGQDKSATKPKKYLIDRHDLLGKFDKKIETLPREGVYGLERITLNLEETLSGKTRYKVDSHIENIINVLATKKVWTFRSRNIISGYEIKIMDIDNCYHVELFGIGTDLYYSNVDKGVKKKEIIISQPNGVLAPGMGFWIFVSVL